MSDNELTKFAVFGERNSGTKYLISTLNKNTNLAHTYEYGFKHWYIKNFQPRGRPNGTTDNECLKPLDGGDSDNTIFIFIVRNPYDWCASMYKRPYHMKRMNKSNLFNFVRTKYIAYENKCPKDHRKGSKTPWKIDPRTKKYFIDDANNLVDLRNRKNKHFYNLKNKVKHFYLIRQEHFKEDIAKMAETFDLKLKHGEFKLEKYRKPSKYRIDNRTRLFIKGHLNNEVDKMFY